MKRIRFSAIISMLLIISLLFTSCGWFKKNDKCAHESTSLQGAKAATCAEEGYTGDTVCNDCTAIVSAGSKIAKKAHTFDTGKVTKQPTCMDTGVTTYTCSACGTIETSPIATVAHSDKYHDAQDGTHWHTCYTCTLNENKQHNPTDGGTFVAASCTEGAYTLLTCADCNGTYKAYDESKPALDHSFGAWQLVSDSTCQETGSKAQVCQREGCGHTNTVTIPVASVHNYSFSYYQSVPNCIDAGVAVYACDDCNDIIFKDLAKTGVHNYIPQEDTGDGWTRKQCEHCGDVISSFNAQGQTSANLTTDNIDTTTSLEMSMQNAAIQFPQDVVGQIASGSDLSISADVLDETAKNNAINNVADADEKAALENAPIYDFTVKIGNSTFSDNFTNKVAITVSYDNGDEDSDGIVIYYLAENGEIEKITDVVYDADTKQVTFFVEHFSFYAVAYQETQAMRCKRGNHNYEATSIKVAASCHSFGYTLYECTGCQRTTVDDIVDRAEHAYGDLIDAKPTCEYGDYITRVCQNEGCGHVLNVKFVGATGHTMDHPATCDTASTCTKCHSILARPVGHQWSDWETVVEATELQNGIRRRYCTVCGAVDEATIASTGTVDTITYDNYIDLFNAVLGDIIGLNSGVIEFEYFVEEEEVKATLNIQKTANGYRMSMTATYTEYSDYVGKTGTPEIDETQTVEFYYDNGVWVATNGEDGAASHFSSLIPMPIDVFKVVAEELHGEIDDFVGVYYDQLKELVANYSEIAGDEINEILAAADIPYTVEEIDDLLVAIETVYAYLSLKLGFETQLEFNEDVALPTAADLEKVLEAFMEASEKNGVTTYTFTEAPILDAADEIIAFTEAHAEDTLAEFIMFVLADELAEIKVTTFDGLVSYLKTNFPGSFTVADAADMIIDIFEENGLSADDFYSAANLILDQMGAPEEFTAEAFLNENGTITLNMLAQQMMGAEDATIEQVYDYFADGLKSMKVGDIDLDGITVAELCTQAKAMLDMIELDVDVSISIDANGRITALNIGEEFWVNLYFDPEADLVKILGFKATIKHDDTVKVEIPSKFKPVTPDVSSYYDDKGNLVINGLNKDIDYNFSIMGGGYSSVGDILERDAALSTEYGAEIYVTKPEYWNNTNHVGSYYLIDGKYYPANYSTHLRYVESTSTVTFAEIAANPSEYFAVNTDWAMGYLDGYDNVPVYQIATQINNIDGYYGNAIAIAYEINGTWMATSNYGYVYDKYAYDEYGNETNLYYAYNATTLDEFYSTIQLGSVTNYNSNKDSYYRYTFVNHDGEFYTALIANVQFGKEGRVNSFLAADIGGETLIIDRYNGWHSDPIYLEQQPVSLPEYDTYHEYNETLYTIDTAGNISEIEAKYVNLSVLVPTYYVRISDTAYANLNSSYIKSSYSTTGLESMKLSDGNTLYILGRTTDNSYGYTYGYETVYGYAKTASGFYIQTAVVMNGSEVVEILYREARETIYLNYRNMYNVEDYLSTDGKGNYVIASTLINNLKGLCAEEGDSFAIQISAEVKVGDINVEIMYYAGAYMITPEVSLGGSMGGSAETPDDYYFWYNMFGNEWSDSQEYTVVKNDDGSITLVFKSGVTISDLDYNGVDIPIEDLLVKDTVKSNETGLDIYKHEDSYVVNHSDGSYVYAGGKYYNYSYQYIYELSYWDNTDFLANWYVGSMYYRFDMVGAEGLPAELPVYQTYIHFRSNPYTYGDYYHDYDYYDLGSMQVYTFFLDGEIYVAVDAYTTGESLLTFEDYMPLDEYIDSLDASFESYNWSYGTYYLSNGKTATVYSETMYLYETDGNGNRLDSDYDYSFSLKYTIENGVKKYVRATYSKGENLVLGSQATPNHPADAERHEWTNSCTNGNFTMVSFDWQTTETRTRYFVKLADRMYFYDSDYFYWRYDSYQSAKLDEWEFQYTSVDKAWVYRVEITDEKGNFVEYKYYSEFIPSDYGFTPSGVEVDPSIIGDIYSETTLGYTAEGNPIVEIAYYVTGDESPYTKEAQADGTVFYHKNGVGYLEVTEKSGSKYYVRARKITHQDGTTSIYCFLRGAVIDANEFEGETMDNFVSVSDNRITFSKEFLDVAASSNKNSMYVRFYCSNWGYMYFNYYQLESLYMLADGTTVNGNGSKVVYLNAIDVENIGNLVVIK